MAVLINGLRPSEPGLEFYRVAPGGATEVTVRGDDRVRVIDRHGGQTAELTARGGEGLAALGVQGEVRKGGFRLFGRDSRPGSDIELIAKSETVLVVGAPAGGLSTATRRQASSWSRFGGQTRAPGTRSSCRRPWPSPGSTSGSTAPPRPPTRCEKASTSR